MKSIQTCQNNNKSCVLCFSMILCRGDMKKQILAIAITFLSFAAKSATVDTISIYSTSMHKAGKCVVIRPAGYNNSKKQFPVVYLLHGWSGNYSDWVNKAPLIKQYADEYQLLIVCPDGGYSSWYIDSPVDSSMRYETYVAIEIPAYIDAHYHTIKKRTARAITGLSMGGHGGLFLGFRHQDEFGACGSMSGGVYLRPFPKNWNISERIGDTLHFAANWENYSVLHIIEQYPQDSLAVIFDCGTGDFFLNVNRQLHEKMLAMNIAHDYIERPGHHDWNYWTNSIQYQLMFFKNYFDKALYKK
jgi:S-formylglutathione hydrolase FrmB